MGELRFSASISLMFLEHGLYERFAAARAAGFRGVEIQVLDEGEPSRMARAAAQAGVDVVLINVGMGDLLTGGAGLSGVPGREAQFLVEFARALEAAEVLGCGFIHLGPSRVPADVSRDDCFTTYRGNLLRAVEMHASCGSRSALLIEAMNRIDLPDALLPDLATAVAEIEPFAAAGVGLLFDAYHVAMNGDDVPAMLARHRRWVRHVQFADAPGRAEPGTGRLEFDSLFGSLVEHDYRGWVGAEYRPGRPTVETLGWLSRWRNQR